MLETLAVFIVASGISYWIYYQAVKSASHTRYVGIMNVAAEKIGNTVSSMEMNAMNEFDEVEKHLDTPASVIAALESKTSLNPEVRGYFAAFEPNYFPSEGQWFEPYVHHVDDNDFEVRQVGSASHNYHKSEWYIRAKDTKESFWSDPYYYFDGTSISGHYTTFVKPIYDKTGNLACVCGADMTFEWLSKELNNIDIKMKTSDLLNKYHMSSEAEFFSVVINKDGSCIAGPEGRSVTMTDEDLISELKQQKSGTIEMTIAGTPSMVFYGPIDHVDWSVAIVVPLQELHAPLLPLGITLIVITILGVLIVWFVCRRIKDVETV
jgi:hypothetical protein